MNGSKPEGAMSFFDCAENCRLCSRVSNSWSATSSSLVGMLKHLKNVDKTPVTQEIHRVFLGKLKRPNRRIPSNGGDCKGISPPKCLKHSGLGSHLPSWWFTPSSHHGFFVENGGRKISNFDRFLSFRIIFHWTMITGERVSRDFRTHCPHEEIRLRTSYRPYPSNNRTSYSFISRWHWGELLQYMVMMPSHHLECFVPRYTMAFDGEIGAYAGPLTGKEQLACWPKPFSVLNLAQVNFMNRCHPKLLCPLKREHVKRQTVFQPSFFKGYLSFPGVQKTTILEKNLGKPKWYSEVFICQEAAPLGFWWDGLWEMLHHWFAWQSRLSTSNIRYDRINPLKVNHNLGFSRPFQDAIARGKWDG